MSRFCYVDTQCRLSLTWLCRRKMQMGIVVGLLLNVLFGLWTYLLASS